MGYFLILKILCCSLFLFGCGLAPEATVSKCNEQQKVCNRKANEDTCGLSSCVELILAGNIPDSFNQRIEQCNKAYSQCLSGG